MPLLEASPDRIAAAARRVMARCDELARVSAQSGAIERVYLSPEHARVNRLAAEWMREVGLRTWQDAAGNQLGRIERSADPDPAAPALMIGSHLDTVKDAGRFDGIIGVLMALEVVRLLRQESEGVSRVPLPFAVEVAAFSDEEGTRFGKALLGSSAVAGTWNDAWWTLADEDGVTLRQAFLEFGLDPGRIGEAARRPDHLVAYLEAHIEQGPELDRAGDEHRLDRDVARHDLVVQRGREARERDGAEPHARPKDVAHLALERRRDARALARRRRHHRAGDTCLRQGLSRGSRPAFHGTGA